MTVSVKFGKVTHNERPAASKYDRTKRGNMSGIPGNVSSNQRKFVGKIDDAIIIHQMANEALLGSFQQATTG